MRIHVEYIGGGQHVLTDGQRTFFLYHDLSLVGIMQDFGMRPRHKNGCTDKSGTDGTINCPQCGQGYDRFYCQAEAYLIRLEVSGRSIVDPGYLDSEE